MTKTVPSTPDPYFIPGYTGFCPQFRYRNGETYGHMTHKLLLDPSVAGAEKMVLADRAMDEFQVFRPPHRDIDILKAREKLGDPVYKHPMVPGYEGFIPRERTIIGQRFMVTATEGLADFENNQLANRQAANQMLVTSKLQDNRYCPKSIDDKEMLTSAVQMPLNLVRPEAIVMLKKVAVPEPRPPPGRQNFSPYFSDCGTPGKFLKAGFGGHVPYGYKRFGEPNKQYTTSALCDFTNNYKRRQSIEWAPVSMSEPEPPLELDATIIYHKHVGMLPNYMGHVPGMIFRCGKTFGTETVDGKRWLRGDFSL